MGAAAVLTLITILAKSPAFAVVGVPESDPVAVLKLAQVGRLTIEKLRATAAVGLVTTGVKLYGWPAMSLEAGVPVIVGAAGGVGATGSVRSSCGITLMRNGPTVARVVPSDTPISISPEVPTFVPSGVPESSTRSLGKYCPFRLVDDVVGEHASVGTRGRGRVLICRARVDGGHRHAVQKKGLHRCARRAARPRGTLLQLPCSSCRHCRNRRVTGPAPRTKQNVGSLKRRSI